MKIETTIRTLSLLVAVSTLPCAGCLAKDDPLSVDDEAPGSLEPSGVQLQGPLLQGPVLQGVTLNGLSLNGVTLNGIAMNGASIQGVAVPQQLYLRGGQLVAIPARGRMMGGEALEGTMLTGELSDGHTLQLQIADVAPTADAEIYEYTVTYWNGTSWGNLCGESNGAPVRALALAGTWDSSSGTPTGGDHVDDASLFTFACKNAAIAKCVGLGYAPWRAVEECVGDECQAISMRDMHQACTRVLRADYCGDGTPHTQNGTLINLWDDFDVQNPDLVLPVHWHDEAEWSPNGALCIEEVRWSGTAEGYIDQHCADRWSSASFECFGADSTFFSKPGFGTPVAGRSLLRNQFTHEPMP